MWIIEKQLGRSGSALANFKNPDIMSSISLPKKKGNSGHPQHWIRQDVRDAVSLLPPQSEEDYQIDCIGVGDFQSLRCLG
jgi:hypothetical protein